MVDEEREPPMMSSGIKEQPSLMTVIETEIGSEEEIKTSNAKPSSKQNSPAQKEQKSTATAPPLMVLPSSLQKKPSNTNALAAAAAAKPETFKYSNVGFKNYTFAVGKGNCPEHIINCLKARGNWTQASEEDAIASSNFLWRQLNLNYSKYDQLDARLESDPSKPFFLNHFEQTRGITTKTGLIRSLINYYQNLEAAVQANYTVFDTTPTTFIVSKISDEDQINLLMTRYKDIARGGSNKERVPVKHCKQNMWLVKPASLNQGRGIEIFRNLRDITEFIYAKNPQTQSWVVQKYVEHPFLFNGRKFDLRVWAVVTDDFRIYFYKHGYLRTSSAEYNLKDKNNYVHLTNQCLQVKGEGYAQHEEGNTLSYEDLQKYFDENFPQYNVNLEEMIIPRIKDIIIDCFLCIKNKMNQNNRKNVFELFGFDFLLDEDFRTWLIEVNYNPFLGMPNDYMKTLVPRMMNDMLKIVLDPVLKPKNQQDPQRENDYQLIYQDASEKNGPAVNVRRPFSLDLCYPIPELTPFIGRRKNLASKEPFMPVRQLNRKVNQAPQLQQIQQNTDKPTEDSSMVNEMILSGDEQITPRKKLATSAIGVRSRSTQPGKQAFNLRKNKTRSSQNYNSQERTGSGSNVGGARNKPYQSAMRKKNGQGGIIEQVEEEDKMSGDYDSGEEAIIKRTIQVKRNLLCKTLLDQTKELCYQHSPVYKDYDQIFMRIMHRFHDWEIFDDKEVLMACASLKVIANSGQIVNLVQEKNMKRVIAVYESKDLHVKFLQEISELFLIIAKNIGLRKIFLNQTLHAILVKNSLAFVEQINVPKVSLQMLEVFQNAIKLLCLVCTARKTQFYIPGETNLSERLRKRAFDSGTFTLLTYLNNKLKDVTRNPFKSIREHIQEQVLNYASLTDLTYHSKLLMHIIQNPQVDHDPATLVINRSSALEERKDFENQPNPDNQEFQEQNTSELDSESQTPNQKKDWPLSLKDQIRINKSYKSQVSPRLNTGKSRKIKRNNSNTLLNNSSSHSQAAGSFGTVLTSNNEKQRQLYEVDTEKLLLSTDKITITDLWKSSPQPSFPQTFLQLLDLAQIQSQADEKANKLKTKIENKKLEKRNKQEEKMQEEARQREELVEQRRMRIMQQERKKEEQKKFAEELKRKSEQQALLRQQQQQILQQKFHQIK